MPNGALVFPLAEGLKIPLRGTRGHLDAVPQEEFKHEGNYGISLDNRYVVVDFDREDTDNWAERLPSTWTQRTRKGSHRLYSVPSGYNAKNKRFSSGDVKVRGYIVGPSSVVAGHTYELLDSREPVPAPQWLLDWLHEEPAPTATEAGQGVSALTQAEGRDNSLHRLGSAMRRIGLDEPAIAKGLSALNQSIVEPPLPQSAITRIAHSAAGYELEDTVGPLKPEGWITAADIPLITPLVTWEEYGFIPKGQLVMVYAKGGTGKSTLGSWLAAKVTAQGRNFGVAAIEEPFELFALRAVLGGGDKERILRVPNPSSLLFPRDAQALGEVIEQTQCKFLFFDSIFSHFEDKTSLNSAERARGALGPLAEVAQQTGCTIMGVFHENKAETYLGSVEMLNVAREVLHLTRQEGKPMYARVVKTNFKHPHKYLRFDGEELAASDPNTGEIQMEEDETGAIHPATIFVIRKAVREAELEDTIDVDTIEQQTPEEKVKEYFAQYPRSTIRQAEEVLGLSKSTIQRLKN